MTDPIPVVFRKWSNGDIIALFPADEVGWYCTSYEHIGQHGDSDYHETIQATTPAKPKEYAQLAKELETIGYKLRPIKRYQRRNRLEQET